jgi:hypothetical protein
MFAMFEGSATAADDDIAEGKTCTFTNMGARIVVLIERKPGMGDNEIHAKLVAGGSKGFREDGKWGYLTAKSSEEGATVITNGESAETIWVVSMNSGGEVTFLHADNKANALSHFPGELKLRRNNDGGKGNKDQIWKLESSRD